MYDTISTDDLDEPLVTYEMQVRSGEQGWSTTAHATFTGGVDLEYLNEEFDDRIVAPHLAGRPRRIVKRTSTFELIRSYDPSGDPATGPEKTTARS